MREIKFRVWDPAGQQMCPVIAADFQDNQSKVFCRLPKSGAHEIFSADLMQYVGQYTGKGRKIAVEGRIQTRSYDAQDGTKRYATEVVVQSMEFCDSKGGGQNASTSPAAPPEQQGMFDGSRAVSDSDIPF